MLGKGAGLNLKVSLVESKLKGEIPFAMALPDFEVLCCLFAAVRDDFVFNLLAFVESPKTRPFNGRDMYEHILAAGLRLDESVSLGCVEPFNGTGRH